VILIIVLIVIVFMISYYVIKRREKNSASKPKRKYVKSKRDDDSLIDDDEYAEVQIKLFNSKFSAKSQTIFSYKLLLHVTVTNTSYTSGYRIESPNITICHYF